MVRAALAAARRAPATGDIPIGAAVFGPDGTELAAACNAREATGDPTAHAEIGRASCRERVYACV